MRSWQVGRSPMPTYQLRTVPHAIINKLLYYLLLSNKSNLKYIKKISFSESSESLSTSVIFIFSKISVDPLSRLFLHPRKLLHENSIRKYFFLSIRNSLGKFSRLFQRCVNFCEGSPIRRLTGGEEEPGRAGNPMGLDRVNGIPIREQWGLQNRWNTGFTIDKYVLHRVSHIHAGNLNHTVHALLRVHVLDRPHKVLLLICFKNVGNRFLSNI